MTNFLPEDYTLPKNEGAYTKLQDGENTLRVLDSAIIGYEYWSTDNKPRRSKKEFREMPEDIQKDKNGKPRPIKHFWAFPVWNYEAKKVQIMEITQSSIMQAITALVCNEKWGNPKGYDITITKTGQDLETRYSVMPNPHTEVDKKIIKQYEDMNINLEALYTGDSPFNGKDVSEITEEANPFNEDAF